jgi:2-polyprenyl-3-methyl-5-hydroxy-6-metoxy-1,4-benzoquinol methylase
LLLDYEYGHFFSTSSRHFQKDHVILELGCGTSRLMHDLANDGYLRLKAIDYSQAAIDLQKANHGGSQRNQYLA